MDNLFCQIKGTYFFTQAQHSRRTYRKLIDTHAKEANKGLEIRVTDQDLLSVTGGIVQGMSGSPILQDGKLVGAVTHVFVSDPARGYGIFIENMLKNVE